MKKVIAVLLCVLMAFGSLPQTIAMAAAGDTGSVETVNSGSKVADPSTLHGWKQFFGTDFFDTANAGGVWADKSVFESVEDFKSAQADGENITQNSAYRALEIEDNNFLVALSGIAANKEIIGYSAIPTDTVFILDLSQSMDNSSYIPTMVRAANSAIAELMKLNSHNRISVILYSGRSSQGTSNLSHATVLLPLDRYTTASDGKYITYSGNNNDTTVSVDGDLRNSKNNPVSKSKQTVGGTYIQSGLYLAAEEFKKAYENGTTEIGSGLIQGGTKRIPIITLMSDGQPTVATDQYSTFERTSGNNNNRVYGVSNYGDGTSSSDTITFLTQLTAKWLKDSAAKWYGNEALFYTLWLKGANDNNTNATLQPETSDDDLDDWWKSFLAAESGKTVTFGTGNNGRFTVTRDSVIDQIEQNEQNYQEKWQAAQNYVDESFNATNSTDFEKAFEKIVAEIILQSQYYPTLVELGDQESSGYIIVEDPIGKFMEVKEIEGILIGGHLFTGSALIEMMKDNQFGNRDEYSENGWKLIEAIQERIGVTETEAIALAQDAWKYGQLGYDSTTGEYSNYIGWYADKDNKYLGFWHEGHTAADVPSDAAQIMKSYGFYGVIDDSISNSNIEEENMMHIAVRVATSINDGDQTVTFGIPASLIPLVNYKVGVNASSLSAATAATLDVQGADHPVRLVMEVGLREGITELNVGEVVRSDGNHHFHTDENGNYLFYTNRWGQDPENEDDGIIELPDPTSSTAAVSYYNPSSMNERYYYNEDTVIYSDTNGTVYRGTEAPSGDVYRIIYRFVGTGNGNAAQIKKDYVKITPAALGFAKHDDKNNFWYIPQGTMRGDIAGFGLAKKSNPTETLAYSIHRDVPGYSEGRYDVYELHGNNGRISLAPATGIELSKYIAVVIPETSTKDFVLNVAFEAEAGTVLPETVKVSYDGKTYTEVDTDEVKVTLDANEKVYIFGLPDGTKYTVTEEDHKDYEPLEESVSGEITEGEIEKVVFQNVARKPGSVVVRKVVEHPFGADESVPENIVFKFEAEFKDENDEVLANKAIATSRGSITTDENGKIEFSLKDGGSIAFNELDKDTIVTVTETELPEGFSTVQHIKKTTVQSEKVGECVFVNTYEPKPVEDVNIAITGEKELLGRDWLVNDSFEFTLLYWNGSHWEEIGSSASVNKDDRDFDLTEAIEGFSFDREGSFNFWVIEESGNIGGVTYDPTHRYFTVNVVDDWSGEYKIDSITNIDPRITYTPASEEINNTHVLDMDFTNTYAPEGSAEIEILIRKNIEDLVNAGYTDLSGFNFAIFDKDGNQIGGAYTTDGSGHAVIKLIYDASVLEEVKNSEGEVIGYIDTRLEYTVKELAPDAANAIPGMSYTSDYAELIVTLEDNLDGTISASYRAIPVEAEGGISVEDNTIVFTNTYNPDPASVTFTGEKILTGRRMEEAEFEFALYETGVDFAVEGVAPIIAENTVNQLDANNGYFGFETIHYNEVGTYHYVIKEINTGKIGVTYSDAEYRITVVVSVGNNGKLEATSGITLNGTDVDNISFENAYKTVEKVVTVTKKWEGIELEERPSINDIGDKIDFQLQKKIGDTGVNDWEVYTDAEMEVVDNGDDTWTVKYTMVFPEGTEIPEFRVVESKVPDNYVVSNGGIAENGVITNTYDIVVVSVSATKVWAKDNENVRPDSSEIGEKIDFELQYYNTEEQWVEYTGNNVSESISVNADGSWSVKYDITFDSAALIPQFRIKETNIPDGYIASNGGVSENGTIINTYDLYEKTIEVTKVWANDTEETRPSVDEIGTALDFELRYEVSDGVWEVYENARREVVDNGNGTWTIKYTMTLEESKGEPNFKVFENKVPLDYITGEEGASDDGTIVNTYNVVENSVVATKVWANDTEKTRPSVDEVGTKIDFELFYKDEDGKLKKYEGTNAKRSVVDNENGTWSVRYDLVFDSLTKIPEFVIVETKVPENYEVSNNGAAENGVITNTYTIVEKTFEATKVWEKDTHYFRPEISEIGTKINFALEYKDGEIEGGWKLYPDAEPVVTVNDDGSWNVRFDVTLEASEVDYEFRIVETKVPKHYEASNGGVAEDGVITNTFKVVDIPDPSTPKTSLTVKKEWDDKNDRYDARPNSVEIQIYADGRKYGSSFILSEANNWSRTVKDLPKYDSNGALIEYTAVEVEVPKYYSAGYDLSINKTIIITNTYGDEPGNPETGAPVFETVVITAGNEVFLPKKREDED